MNYNQFIIEYISHYAENEPIFFNEIKKYVITYKYDNNYFYSKLDEKKLIENLRVIINRLNKEKKIKTFYKGIYYKPIKNVFGEMPLDKNKVIEQQYLKDENGGVKGYVTGAKLYNQLGLTTQIPNTIDIVTNVYQGKNEYKNKYLNVNLNKAKIEINNTNYKYLQLIDLINNKDKIHIEVDNADDIVYQYIKKNDLNFEKIIKYARQIGNKKKILEKLYILAR